MAVQEYLRLLRRHWKTVTIAAIIGLLAAGLASYLTTPSYQAETRMFVSTQSGETNSDLMQGGNFTQQRVQSYADVATSPQVLEPVIKQLRLSDTPAQLGKRVTAQSPTGTVLLALSVSDKDPKQAKEIANAVAASLTTTISELEKPETGASPVKATIVQPATVPTSPVTPKIPRNLALGLVLGLLIGVGLALLRETLDTKIRTEDDLRAVTEATMLGGVPNDKETADQPLVMTSNPQGPRAEAFRQVRTNLQFADVSAHLQTVLVTSSIPGEGKSTTSVNLAATIAETGRTVCLIEADLRRPKAVDYLGLEGGAGLTTVLIGEAELDDVLQPWGHGQFNGRVEVLATGPLPPNPTELLDSERMQALLDDLKQRFDMVVIDAPPLLPVADATVLARKVDGVILIVGSGRADARAVDASLESLEKVGARLLGIVMNRMPTRTGGYDRYKSYAYTTAERNSAAVPRQLLTPKQRVGSPQQAASTVVPQSPGRVTFGRPLTKRK